MSVKSKLVADLIFEMQRAGIYNGWVTELKFYPSRKWAFDLANKTCHLAIEVQGATWSRGRHSRGGGQIFEYEKLNYAARLGWRMLYFDTRMIKQPPKFKAPAKTAMEARRRELYGCAVEHIEKAMALEFCEEHLEKAMALEFCEHGTLLPGYCQTCQDETQAPDDD